MEIKYKKGDVIKAGETQTFSPDCKKIVIPHVTNDKGGWGAGFVVALSNYHSLPEEEYRQFCERTKEKDRLGEIQLVKFGHGMDFYVANMCAQTLGYKDGKPPIRYSALVKCMEKVAICCKALNAEIYCPRFGAGLAGGDWNEIEEYIKDYWIAEGIPVTVYDL